MKGSQGYRRKSRGLRVKPRDRGKVRIKRYLQKFNEGETVSIKIDASYRNIPRPRFEGKSGKVVATQGRAYYIDIRDVKKRKKLLVAPEHLIKIRGIKDEERRTKVRSM